MLRPALAYVSHGSLPGKGFSLSQASSLLIGFPSRELEFARAPDFRWLTVPASPAGTLREQRIGALLDAHGDDPKFGYRLFADEARQAGFSMANRTACPLRRDQGSHGITLRPATIQRPQPAALGHQGAVAVSDCGLD